MKTSSLKISGAYLIANDCFHDVRGTFHPSWEAEPNAPFQFKPAGAYYSYNNSARTLRGLHYQRSPHTQAKIVSCLRGTVFDVILDLRPDSPTYLQCAELEMTAKTGESLYIPHGCAHGFLTQADDTLVAYLIEGTYVPTAQATVRWDDPILQINWPYADELIMSERDRTVPDFAP